MRRRTITPHLCCEQHTKVINLRYCEAMYRKAATSKANGGLMFVWNRFFETLPKPGVSE
jgi:hypothetical protein